jgi:3-phosphoshikimate 1-carboxyvinyltransferase
VPAAPPTFPAELAVEPLSGPLDATVVVPGSKSLTNRALVAAALASGTSVIEGALFADDTEAMVEALRALGFDVLAEPAAARVTVTGAAGVIPRTEARIHTRFSGTTTRFIVPVAALGHGRFLVDAAAPMRSRPMDDIIAALRTLGASIADASNPGHVPFRIEANGLRGGTVALPGNTSSQFLSGLLLAAPAMADGLRVELTTELVSRSYVGLTGAVMDAFGAHLDEPDDHTFVVPPSGYRATDYRVEPDASAASYFFAAAAICGGRVRVEGLGAASRQGDAAFVDLLEQMGAEVRREAGAIEVRGTGRLEGIEVDMSDLSDTAQTLAAVAAFASTPTRVTGIGFIRRKETDRIAAVVAELRRCGVDATEEDDGFVVRPGAVHGAVVQTYDDHRMAMSFALLGLRVPGIRIADPACVTKTFPTFFQVLDGLRVGPAAPAG